MARNTDVSPYIGKLSRSQVYSKKGQYKRERKGVPSAEPTAAEKRASYYPADDSVSRPKISRKVNKPTKLRATITPGTVVILLAGRFRGQSTLHHSVASFVPPSRRETVCERERGRGGGGESGEN
jgi:large subunit ribosomal protein L6e